MILRFFRREEARRRAVQALHLRVERAARAPGLYRRLGVPDTVEGRFEAVCLHVYLVLRRLKALPPPADDVAQDLVNAVFAQLDASLRELGVGDVAVPKRMKKLASAFYGRAAGYDAALDAGDRAALSAVLARNVLGCGESGAEAGFAERLADYTLAAESGLAGLDLDGLLGPALHFPAPEAMAIDGRTA